MKQKQHIFIISEGETPSKSLKRDAGTFVLFLALVGVGWIADSSPMQWAGFLVAVIIILAKANGHTNKYMSADDAIAKIEEIKRQELLK